MPLANAHVISEFGQRGRRFHTGIDLKGKPRGGDPVLASRPGRVTIMTRLSGYGKIIEITHDDGFKTRYAHLKSFKVALGQKVQTGQVIGIVGKTGRATTAHLHFEILTPKSRFLNPRQFLPLK
jgi:murein DD-endopeptidase MepM/ murein hydrolase activator NlpD